MILWAVNLSSPYEKCGIYLDFVYICFIYIHYQLYDLVVPTL